MTNPIDRRLIQIDIYMPMASVELPELPRPALDLAHDLCQTFDLQRGSLIRRANAIALADGENAADASERLKEAAQHLIVRSQQ